MKALEISMPEVLYTLICDAHAQGCRPVKFELTEADFVALKSDVFELVRKSNVDCSIHTSTRFAGIPIQSDMTIRRTRLLMQPYFEEPSKDLQQGGANG